MSAPEVLLIGTGPPMLLEGMIRAKAGQKLIFVDEANSLGGSWKCPEVLGHQNIETGVHLIENRPHLNRVFEALIPPSHRVESGLDFGLWRGHRFPMNYARIALYSGIAGRNLLKGNLERVQHSIKNASEALRYRDLPFIYPKQGIAHVLAKLQAHLIDNGATFHFDQSVTRIDAKGPSVEVETDKGHISVDQLVISSRAHAPIAGMEQFWQRDGSAEVISLILKINGPAPLFNGYVEIINDPVIKRARNITAFAKPKPSAEAALIVLQLRRPISETPPNDVIQHLIKLGLLNSETGILQHHVDSVRLNTLTDLALDKIEAEHSGKVKVLRTVDLGDSRFDVAPQIFENLGGKRAD